MVLGGEFEPEELPFWSHSNVQNPQRRRNVVKVATKAKTLLQRLRSELQHGRLAEEEHRSLYVDLTYFVLFDELLDAWEYPVAIHRSWEQRSVRTSTPEIWKRYRFQSLGEHQQSGTATGSSSSRVEPEIAKLARQIAGLELTADELISAYCKIAYGKTRSFEKAAHRLQLDRRTVRKKSDARDAQ
jgi:hypothetical protein